MSSSTYGSFAARMMAKQGWKEGEGLGARGQGRSDPLRPALKFDTAGLGSDPAREFTDHWWDVAFNRAAGRIKVDTDEQTVRRETPAGSRSWRGAPSGPSSER